MSPCLFVLPQFLDAAFLGRFSSSKLLFSLLRSVPRHKTLLVAALCIATT